MAAAAFTTTKQTNVAEVFGQKKFVAFTITWDTGDYAAGGFAIPTAVQPNAFGLSEYQSVMLQSSAGGYVAEYVPSTKKIKLYTDKAAATAAPFTEAPASPLVAATLTVWAIGI